MYYTIIILILFSYFLGRKNGKKEYDKININDINVIIDKLQNGKF